jgi:TonB-dependent starch-binding outer membrane protein SusC
MRKHWYLLSWLTAMALVGSANAQRPGDSGLVTPAGSVALRRNPERSGAVSYSIDSTEIMASAARTLSEVLQARAPSLDVLQSGGVAAQGAQIRSRGVHSFFMAGEPIVIVDGLRVNAIQDATVVDLNVSTSRLDDIAPEDIARIDVLPGAAAAGIYGPGAAGGALVITTKRGAGRGIHFAARTRAGVGVIGTRFPSNYQLQGTLTATGQPSRCVLFQVATGDCTPTRLEQWNPLENASPFRTARTTGEALTVDGGFGQTSGRLSLTGDHTLGVTSDDDAGRLGARATVTQRIGRSLELNGNWATVQTSDGLPARGGLLDASNVIGNGLLGAATSDSIQGYRPAQAWTSTRERAHHWTGGASLNWDGLSWLSFEADYGRDHVRERDERPGAFIGSPAWIQTFELGSLDHDLTTAAISARSTEWSLFRPSIRTRTIASVEQLRSSLTAEDSQAVVNSSPPLVGLAGMSDKWRIANEALRQEFALGDRVRLGAGARWERWSRFGEHLPTRFFKSADLSWWLGSLLHVDSLRLRAAYGEAGNWSPGEPGRVGKPNWLSQPIPEFFSPEERVAESEIGADFAFTHRASVSVTAFRAEARHLWIVNGTAFFPPPDPSGALRNDGLELNSRVLLLQRASFQWDATVRGDLLKDRTGAVGGYNQWIINGGAMDRPGYPVGSYFQRPYTYTDANHDGLISPAEIQYAPGSPPDIVGSSLPNREASLLSTLSVAHAVRFSALLDYRGGQHLANMGEAWRCAVTNCRAVNDPSAPLADQARALVGINGPLTFFEGASFLKLRELSLAWSIPPRFARLLGASGTITLAGRNLATWTRYRGLDPELNEQPLNMLPRVDYAETPIPREVLLRFDLGGSTGR